MKKFVFGESLSFLERFGLFKGREASFHEVRVVWFERRLVKTVLWL